MFTVEDYKKHLQPADRLMTKATGINFYYLGDSIVNESQVDEYFAQHKKKCCAELRHLNSAARTILQNYCLLLFGKREIYYSRFPEDGDPYPNIRLETWLAKYLLSRRPNLQVLPNLFRKWDNEGRKYCKEVDGYFFTEKPNMKPFEDLNEWLFLHPLYMDEAGTVFELKGREKETTTNPQTILSFANPVKDGYVMPKGRIRFLGVVNTNYGSMDSLKSLRGQGNMLLPWLQVPNRYKDQEVRTCGTQSWEVLQ